jgi:hypothetical protein
MRKRAIGTVLAAGSLLAMVPAGSHAETVDTTCRNGNDPVVFTRIDARPVTVLTVRAICVQDEG